MLRSNCRRCNMILEHSSVIERDFRVVCDSVKEYAVCLRHVTLAFMVLICRNKWHCTFRILCLSHLLQWGLQQRLLRPIVVHGHIVSFARRILSIASVLTQARITLEHARLDTSSQELRLSQWLMAWGLWRQTGSLCKSHILRLFPAHADDFATAMLGNYAAAFCWTHRRYIWLVMRQWLPFLLGLF